MDHHCPWLNTCVGISNHNYFIIMLYSLLAYIICLLAFTSKTFYQIIYTESLETHTFKQHIMKHNFFSQDLLKSKKVFLGTHICILAMLLLALYLVGILCKYQTCNFLSNMTNPE